MIEQWHTIEEAEKLWCMMTKDRLAYVQVEPIKASVETGGSHGTAFLKQDSNCIGPRCMAWIKYHESIEPAGRCGMVR